MEQARAAEAAAQAQNEKQSKARQEQIQAAYEMWQKAIAGVDIAEKSYKRVKNLFDQESCLRKSWTKSLRNVMQPSPQKSSKGPIYHG